MKNIHGISNEVRIMSCWYCVIHSTYVRTELPPPTELRHAQHRVFPPTQECGLSRHARKRRPRVLHGAYVRTRDTSIGTVSSESLFRNLCLLLRRAPALAQSALSAAPLPSARTYVRRADGRTDWGAALYVDPRLAQLQQPQRHVQSLSPSLH